MKTSLILVVLIGLTKTMAGAQVPDTMMAAREIDSLIQVSRSLANQRDFGKALEVNAAAEKIALEKMGRQSVAYGSTTFNHGKVLYFMGNYPEAEKWYLDALSIRSSVLGKEHPAYAQSLNNLANLYWKIGNYEKAEPLHLEAIAIREKRLGKENLDYAASLNNLANVYFDLGNG